jgi:EmrB/QacA subfamily drug resistance transporter
MAIDERQTADASDPIRARAGRHEKVRDRGPWPALWALVLGFFMILVDSTIVSVATPAIIRDLDADVNSVIWVTSAYLLAYAVPLLVTGRLGDRFGPKYVYLVGLALFTAASLWCGLTGSITELVVARVFQGLGASLMTPQTMAVITRTFPAGQRGQAMSLWGATAGVATLVGPLVGGLLVDGPGWAWIFFINVPVGLVGLVLAWRLVPRLETHSHSFDLVGVALSSVGMFCLVFGIQEGETYDWGTITGFLSVPLLIGVGLVVLGVFVWWQSHVRTEPLVPLSLFRDRNFSLSNAAITTVGFAITAMAFPFMLFTQAVLGYSPTKSALLLVPVAVFSGALAPLVGRFVDTVHPRYITAGGMLLCSVSLFWVSRLMTPSVEFWQLLVPMALLGVANAGMWAPLAATATRNLPLQSAGAGAGIYNTTRQIGAVLGSAAIAAVIEARLVANLGPTAGSGAGAAAGGTAGSGLPPQVASGLASAMSEAILLPSAILLLGVVAALFFAKPSFAARPAAAAAAGPTGAGSTPADAAPGVTGA